MTFGIHHLLQHHKKTVFFNDGVSVDCVLRMPSASDGYPLKGFTSFIGLTITESGTGVFADSFELTLNADDVFNYTEEIPARGWGISVALPQFNNEIFNFTIEDVAADRTLGMYLLKCSSNKKSSNQQQIFRRNGGI